MLAWATAAPSGPAAGAGQRYSYAALAAAAGVGAVFPAAAAAVLGPVLLAGLAGLGVAHGACDQLVLPAHQLVQRARWGYQLRFGLGYVGLAGAVGLLWWQWPAVAVAFFFVITAWHWGSADAPAHPRRAVWVAHSLLRGALLLAIPACTWPAETARSVAGLLALAGAAPAAASSWAGLGPPVLVGHLLLWAGFARAGQLARARRDAGEVALLVGLGLALPPLLALGVYFVFWHSLQHVLRLAPLLGYVAGPGRPGLARPLGYFLRRALPVLGISLAGVAVVYGLGFGRRLLADGGLGLAVVAAALVTLPHALLVSLVMDAPNWQRPRSIGS